MEHLYLYPILKTQKIIAYYRYVGDVLIIIYDGRKQMINDYLMILTLYIYI
jgi:hypothetical protein